MKYIVTLLLLFIGINSYGQSINDSSDLLDNTISGQRWGDALSNPPFYNGTFDTTWVIGFENELGGSIVYLLSVPGDTTVWGLRIDSLGNTESIFRSTTNMNFNNLLEVGDKDNSTFGVRLPYLPNQGTIGTDANGKIIAGSGGIGDISTIHLTYAQAQTLVSAGGLLENRVYNIVDDSVYLFAVNDSQFSLNGYYVDSTIWEIDAIEFDFANEHIQQRCDKRNNCVGAAFGLISNGLISADPISVFKWGDDFVIGNTVKDAVFDLTNIVGSGDAFIISNVVTQLSEVTVGNNGNLNFQKNTAIGSVTWSSLYSTNNIFENIFTQSIDVNTDSTDAQIQDNQMYGANQYFRINRATGSFSSNEGQGHISCVGCNDVLFTTNNLFNGAYIFADSSSADINANELHRGSELHMEQSDSAFSKNYLDFTAIVYANNNTNRTEYNRIIGCRNGLGTVFNVTMTTTGRFGNNTIISCGDTVTFDPNTVYDGLFIEFNRNIGVGTIDAPSKLTVSEGDVYVTDIGNGVIFTSPDGTCWRQTVDNAGQAVITSITCP
jgi:hypothetical protein